MNFYDDYTDEIYDDTELLIELDDMSLSGLYDNCVLPSFQQLFNYIKSLLLYSFVFRIVCCMVQRHYRLQFIVHLMAIVCGNLALLSTAGRSAFFSIAFIYFTCGVLLVLMKWRRTHGYLGYVVGALCLIILTACEIFQWNPTVWRQIRGVQMIATMKIVSLSFDIDAKTVGLSATDPLTVLGYLFCPTNCVLGPWTNYNEYLMVLHGNVLFDTRTAVWFAVNLNAALFFAIASNCWVPTLLSNKSWRWLVAYRDALSFRCSHYFISYLSQLTMVAGGFANSPTSPLTSSKMFGYQVVKPLSMEFPRSLTEVVTDWNIPIHNWLKQYVFRIVRRKSTSLAIFFTYLVSSLLHGMNIQLAVVLLSLGLISLIEHNLRTSVADALNACVKGSSCKVCDHTLKRYSPITLLVNGLFSGFTIVHLTFLGTIFNMSASGEENGTLSHMWATWSELNFTSYWICFGCLVCDVLLKI